MVIEAAIEVDASQFPLVEPTPAPEIYVDGYQGVLFANGVAKFNMFTVVMDAENSQNQRRIVQRLCMTIPTLEGIHIAIGELLEQMKKDGIAGGNSGKS